MDSVLQEILPYLPSEGERAICALPDRELPEIREIRVKVGHPTVLMTATGRKICGSIQYDFPQIEGAFRRICASSAYSHRNEIRSGFVTIPGGHRVGIMGSAVLGAGGTVEGMREIYGLSYRVAREYPVDTSLFYPEQGRDRPLWNLMILGPPCSGKTTVLRALAKDLGERFPVSVIDEREELFPSCRPVPLGCDVLRGYPKAVGVQQALRTLSPRVMVCDEIGTGAEVSALLEGLRSGVAFIASGHAYSEKDLFFRPPVRELFLCGGVDRVVFLDPLRPSRILKIREREDLCAEMDDVDSHVSAVRRDGRHYRS